MSYFFGLVKTLFEYCPPLNQEQWGATADKHRFKYLSADRRPLQTQSLQKRWGPWWGVKAKGTM